MHAGDSYLNFVRSKRQTGDVGDRGPGRKTGMMIEIKRGAGLHGKDAALCMLRFFFLIAQVSQDERDGILGFQRADDINRCSHGDLIKKLGNLRIIKHDTTERLIRNSLRDAVKLNESWHMLAFGNQPCLLSLLESATVVHIGIV